MSDDGALKLESEINESGTRLRPVGRIMQSNAGAMWREATALLGQRPETPVTLDLEGVEQSDSAGAAFVMHLRELCAEEDRSFEVLNVGPSVRHFLDVVQEDDLSTPDWPPEPDSFFVQVGNATLRTASDVRTIVAFIGGLALSLFQAIVHPSRLRWRDTFYYMERVGADALPIMSLISILVGLILAFLGYNQLNKVGADVFVADGVAYGMARVFGPLMVAILCAGRSGSAFAAEIGTMKVSEEVDAMDIMALDRARFLVVPKVIALILMMPILTLYSDLGGMVGGFLVSVIGFKIPGTVYIQRSVQVLTIWTVCSGLVKSVVFAMVVAAVGCLRGLQTRQGAKAVGEVTTSAVVSGLFLIVVVEGIFSVVYHYLGL